jgi:hypothetical protein
MNCQQRYPSPADSDRETLKYSREIYKTGSSAKPHGRKNEGGQHGKTTKCRVSRPSAFAESEKKAAKHETSNGQTEKDRNAAEIVKQRVLITAEDASTD